MPDVLGYAGKKVVITGAASGMGAAASELLVELGAEVTALDIADVKAPVQKFVRTDMKSKESIDAALAELPDEIDVHFNCAGVPCPPFSPFDTVMINFVGLRHLTDGVLPRMRKGGSITSIALTAGMAWKSNIDLVNTFLDLGTFEAGEAWLQDPPDLNADPYGFSKQCIIVYTQRLAGELAKRGVRINSISPSPTASAFMTQLKTQIPADALEVFQPSIGREADPAEMGRALVLLGTDLAGFISGVNLPVDFGYCAEVAMGQRDNLMGIS